MAERAAELNMSRWEIGIVWADRGNEETKEADRLAWRMRQFGLREDLRSCNLWDKGRRSGTSRRKAEECMRCASWLEGIGCPPGERGMTG